MYKRVHDDMKSPNIAPKLCFSRMIHRHIYNVDKRSHPHKNRRTQRTVDKEAHINAEALDIFESSNDFRPVSKVFIEVVMIIESTAPWPRLNGSQR